MLHPNCDQSDKKLDLPPVNVLIPTEFDIKERKPENCKVPFLLKKWDGCTDLWYKQDDKFEMPKEIVSLKIYSSDC